MPLSLRPSLVNVPVIFESKPDMSYYCVKTISVKRLDRQRYEAIKATQAYKQEFIQSQSLAAVFYAPENILKRAKFKLIDDDAEDADAGEPNESEKGI